MTQRELIRQEVLTSLAMKLQAYGFKLNKSETHFTQKNQLGWFRLWLLFYVADEGWDVNLVMLIRCNIVEEIYHQISGFQSEKDKKNSFTISKPVKYYGTNKTPTPFIIVEESQIQEFTNLLFKSFVDEAIPFFEKYNSLQKIDFELNTNPQGSSTSLIHDISKGTISLIIAKLVNHSNYGELVSIYWQHYKSYSGGYYLPVYKKLVKLLESL